MDQVKQLTKAFDGFYKIRKGIISIDLFGGKKRVHCDFDWFKKNIQDYDIKAHDGMYIRLSKTIDGIEFFCLAETAPKWTAEDILKREGH